MRVLIAPDKFKGTLTAAAAAHAIARGWQKIRPQDQLTLHPISDGGDGFGAVMSAALHAKPRRLSTLNAAHQRVTATWWWQSQTRTAIIESANIIGLAMLPPQQFHPFQLDTYGLGAAIQTAQQHGARQIILGIGGSATNDGGFGLARALGWKFFDPAEVEIQSWPKLIGLKTVQPPSTGRTHGQLIVAVDVNNPLLGRHGATRIYGPQKGLLTKDFAPAERALRRLAQVMTRQFASDFAAQPGAGAAGGLGFGLATFARAQLVPGFDLLARETGLLRKLLKADLMITAEGAMDRSTLMGKGAGQIALLARRKNLPVIGLAGVVRDSRALGKLFTRTHALVELTPAAAAQRRAAHWLTRLSARTAASWEAVNPQWKVGKSARTARMTS